MRLSLFASLFLSLSASAMEGMWLPEQMSELNSEITGLGFELDPAILGQLDGNILGSTVDMGYCSAAFVSPDGLIATAYHCVTDGLQYASRSGEDLFEDGFHAANGAEERWAGPTEHIRITTGLDDVTPQVLAGTKKLHGLARIGRIDSNKKSLVRRCEGTSGTHCEVAEFGNGTAFKLITQTDIQDMRLVFAPPNSVGYFGEDADNWQWPRHSGDFAFFRAYVGPKGESRPFHPDNVPYKPTHWLKVASKSPDAGEFVGIAGHPAGTWRWRDAAQLEYNAEEHYPRRLRIHQAEMAIFERYAKQSEELHSKIAPRILNTSNNIVYYQGLLDDFERFGTVKDKWDFEADLGRWIAADPNRAEHYGAVIEGLQRLQGEASAHGPLDDLTGRMYADCQLFNAALTLYQLSIEGAKPDKTRREGLQNRDRPQIASELDSIESSFDWRLDRDMTRWFLLELLNQPSGRRPAELDNWFASLPHAGTTEEKIDAELALLYKNGDLMDPDKRRSLMDTSQWYLDKSNNPWFKLAAALQPEANRAYNRQRRFNAQWQELRPQYIKAVQAFYPEARPRYLNGGEFAKGLFYPDANGTLRVTIGKVDGYNPADGLIAESKTRVDGIMDKAGPHPYDVFDDLQNAIIERKFGRYEDPKLRSVPVNFLSTLDTARGNSGSATFNKKGEFVGILFDGNYEAIASDWSFNEAQTRSIHTDVGYILWYLDRVAGASSLLQELGQTPIFAKTNGE